FRSPGELSTPQFRKPPNFAVNPATFPGSSQPTGATDRWKGDAGHPDGLARVRRLRLERPRKAPARAPTILVAVTPGDQGAPRRAGSTRFGLPGDRPGPGRGRPGPGSPPASRREPGRLRPPGRSREGAELLGHPDGPPFPRPG